MFYFFNDTMNKLFEVKILNQKWLDFEDADRLDLCSHGSVFLKVNDIEMLSDQDGDWGVSETALSLLRSANFDYPEKGKDNTVIFHGCGTILMMGCPIRITWNTKHKEGHVFLDDFKKFPTTNEKNVVMYPKISVKLRESEYASIIYDFASQAKSLFEGTKKVIEDGFDRTTYENFWNEFNELLEMVKKMKNIT